MSLVLKNNASTLLAADISSTDTTLTVTSGEGALFPTLGASDFFYATLQSTDNAVEIVKVTARADDTFTVVRGQENTVSVPFLADSRFELRVTVENIASQISGYNLLGL